MTLLEKILGIKTKKQEIQIPYGTLFKTCITCKKSLPITLEYFTMQKYTRDGFKGECRKCATLRGIKFQYKKRYNIEYSEALKLKEKQNNKCAFEHCNASAEHFDHNHHTGKVREWLCGAHNLIIQDRFTIQDFEDAIEYYKKHDMDDF